MSDLITLDFLTVFVAGSIVAATPVALAGIGETISQRSGVLNVGVEGAMLVAAYVAFSAAYYLDSIPAGLVAGVVTGGLMALPLVILHIRLGLNAIVIGIAVVIAAEGVTSFLHGIQYGSSYPRLGAPSTVDIPLLSDLPVLGPSLFGQNVVVYLMIGAAVIVLWMFRSTNAGLELRAAGDRPEALDNTGVSVTGTRARASIVSGMFAGLGGAYLACISAGVFVPFMSNGAGFIAVMLAMVARDRPHVVILGALLYGLALSFVTSLQLVGLEVPTDLVQTLPFMVVLALLAVGKAPLPATFGRPFVRGER